MTPRRFFLYGIGGLYNYGCEAIVRGTAALLRSQWPDCRIIYLSRRPQQDQNALHGCPVETWDNRFPGRWHPRNMLRAGLRRLGLPAGWVDLDRFRAYKPGDTVLLIGGDIYTLDPGPYPRRVDIPSVAAARRIASRGAQVILWGASVGPFEAWPAAVPVYRQFLAGLDLITVREPRTAAYLNSLGITHNTVPMPDPAFAMEASPDPLDWPFADDGRPTIGVNLSPLSAAFVYGGGNLRRAIADQAAFLQTCIASLGARVLLIPHVVCPEFPLDDDYAYLRGIYDSLVAGGARDVALLPAGLGARRTKAAIARCRAVMAARMHCAVAAVSQGVPALFLSYSAKAAGMAEYVYGQEGLCLGLQQIASSATLDLLKEMLAGRICVPEPIYDRAGSLRRRYAEALERMARL